MEGQPVRIAGLTALRRDLKRAEALEELAEIGAAMFEAGTLIRAAAAARARATGRRVDEKLADSYRVSKAKAKVAIRLGERDKPYLIGQEWGAHHDRPRPVRKGNRTTMRGWNQFPEVVRGGRFLYPAAAENRERVIDIIAVGIVRALDGSSDDGGDS